MSAIDEETQYLTYKRLKSEGMSATGLAAYFGRDLAVLDLRLQAEKAAEKFTYREPIDMVCKDCGRKHCHGHHDQEPR